MVSRICVPLCFVYENEMFVSLLTTKGLRCVTECGSDIFNGGYSLHFVRRRLLTIVWPIKTLFLSSPSWMSANPVCSLRVHHSFCLRWLCSERVCSYFVRTILTLKRQECKQICDNPSNSHEIKQSSTSLYIKEFVTEIISRCCPEFGAAMLQILISKSKECGWGMELCVFLWVVDGLIKYRRI